MGGNTKGRRRRFGAVRQLPSGQWQARYQGPDGLMRPADQTFPTKTSAERWLTRTEADIIDSDWIDPDAGLIPFANYAAAWIEERPDLRPKTVELYRYLLRRHLAAASAFGSRTIAEIRDAQVRRWRKALLDCGVSPVTVAKAYRLLKAIMNTAVEDGLIRRNPCRIKGAGQVTRTARAHRPPGVRPGRLNRSPLPGTDPLRRVHQPALGRTGRATPPGHQPGHQDSQDRAIPDRAAWWRLPLRPAEVRCRAAHCRFP